MCELNVTLLNFLRSVFSQIQPRISKSCMSMDPVFVIYSAFISVLISCFLGNVVLFQSQKQTRKRAIRAKGLALACYLGLVGTCCNTSVEGVGGNLYFCSICEKFRIIELDPRKLNSLFGGNGLG